MIFNWRNTLILYFSFCIFRLILIRRDHYRLEFFRLLCWLFRYNACLISLNMVVHKYSSENSLKPREQLLTCIQRLIKHRCLLFLFFFLFNFLWTDRLDHFYFRRLCLFLENNLWQLSWWWSHLLNSFLSYLLANVLKPLCFAAKL